MAANGNYNSLFSTVGTDKSGRRVTVAVPGKPGMTSSQMSTLARNIAKQQGLTGVSGVTHIHKHK